MARPGDWPTVPLGEVLELKRGYDLPKRLRVAGNVPIISSSGPSGMHNESKCSGPGVVTGRYGTVGEVFFIEGDYWPLNTALYVRDFKGRIPASSRTCYRLSSGRGTRTRLQFLESTEIMCTWKKFVDRPSTSSGGSPACLGRLMTRLS